MKLEELMNFIAWENQRLNEHFRGPDRERQIYLAALKVVEEIGELSAEVLARVGAQRKEKMHKYTKETLSEELVDVIFTALLLAECLEIDVEKAMKGKMEKVKERIY